MVNIDNSGKGPAVTTTDTGRLVTAKDDSWTPTKGNLITAGVTALVTGAMKWYEIHTQQDIPAELEIAIITAAVGLANYFTPTSIKVYLG